MAKRRRPARTTPPRSRPTTSTRAQRKRSFPLVALLAVFGISAIATLVVVLAGSGGGGTSGSASSATFGNGEVVSESGIHWHPELSITIKGQKQTIPANIGIGPQHANSKWYDPMMQMTDVHTHDSSGTLHWEVMDSMAPVKRNDIRLGVFFEIWGKPFNATQILDNHNGPDGTVTMTVNGKPNTDFDNYLVHDGDQIQISYQ